VLEIKGSQSQLEDAGEIEKLVGRIASAPQLNGSPKLKEFFQYVMTCYLKQTPEDATEQQIGIHVFGRKPGFNSSEDSVVRSQARLLRMKLALYFANEGLDEPILIDIPKGHYLPVLRPRKADGAASLAELPALGTDEPLDGEAPVELASASPPTIAARAVGARPYTRALLIALAMVLLAGLGYGVGRLMERRASMPPASALDQFWAPFLSPASSSLVIYSNPEFVGTPGTGLILSNGHSNQAGPVDDTYTGTGEAAAIYELTKLFDSRKASFTLKRSRLVTWDEAKSRNLIFVGAPSQNTALQYLPTATEFTIAMDEAQHGYFVNRHPRPGEPARFPSPDAGQETALIALQPGLQADKLILVFSGLTTIGTEAAVEFACQPQNAARLLELAGSSNGAVKPFEAILHVNISQGVGVGAQLIALHTR